MYVDNKFDDKFNHCAEYCKECDTVVEVYQTNSVGHVAWRCCKCNRILDQLFHDGPDKKEENLLYFDKKRV